MLKKKDEKIIWTPNQTENVNSFKMKIVKCFVKFQTKKKYFLSCLKVFKFV